MIIVLLAILAVATLSLWGAVTRGHDVSGWYIEEDGR